MSFKRKQDNIAFSISVTPDKRKKVLVEDDIVAILAPFNPFPKVSFTSVKLNKTETREITLRNPAKRSIHVELTKLPENDRGFQWSATEFELPAETETKFTITWTPSQYGSWRDNIKITNKINKKNISEITLLSSTENPPKIVKKCLRSSQSGNNATRQTKTVIKKGTSVLQERERKTGENKENISQQAFIKTSRKKELLSVQDDKNYSDSSQPSLPGNSLGACATLTSVSVVSESSVNSASRRTTYEIVPLVASSRRSTYLLRNQQLANIIDLENERLSFESIASPVMNESLENAVSKLVKSEPCDIPELSNVVLGQDKDAVTESTFIISNVSSSMKNDCNTQTSRRTTFEDFEPSSLRTNVTCNTPDQSCFKYVTSPAFLCGSRSEISKKDNLCAEIEFKDEQLSARFSLDSQASTDKFYDSLEDERSKLSKGENLLAELEDYNFSASSPDFNQEGRQTLMESLSKDIDVSFDFQTNENALNSTFKIITTPLKEEPKFKQKCNPSCSFEQVEESPVGLVEIINIESGQSEISKTVTGSTFIIPKSSSPENKALKIPSTVTQVHEIKSESIEPDVLKVETSEIPKHSTHSNLPANSQDPLLWSVSPPKKNKQVDIYEDNGEHSTKKQTRFELKTKPTKRTSNLSKCAMKNIMLLNNKINLNQISSDNGSINLRSSDTSIYNKGMDDRGSTEKLFAVPLVGAKRLSSALPKSINRSPPKIRKMTPELKVKRLNTPVMLKKPTISCSAETSRTNRIQEVPQSQPRSLFSAKKRKSLKVNDWIPVQRLRLSSHSGSNNSVDLLADGQISATNFDPTTPDPFIAATSLNPFAEGGLYLSEEWKEDQEAELLEWADWMLRPPSELQLDRDHSERGTLHRLNALRTTAFNLLLSAPVAIALAKVKMAVDKKTISIRSDKQLHVDLGLQDMVIQLLMSYNPLWLRLCLEAIYQTTIHLKRHSDSTGLINFIRKRVINDDFLHKTYSHPTIPNLMQPEFEDKMKKFTLYKFLVLVYLLDLLKCKKVMLHDPCLFRKDSKYKSSREILLEFNKEFIAGAGDITRILRLKGYEVFHCQTYLDEFDFSIKNRSELRDGVRLTKLTEILIGNNLLCSKLRVPAISSLQKKYNAEVAFTALKNAGFQLPEEVSPKDISDGHKEKTLSFLWHLRGIIQKRSVNLIIMKWRETKLLRQDRRKFLQTRNSVIKIQKWYKKVKEVKSMSTDCVKKAQEERDNFLKLRLAVILFQRQFRKKKEEHMRKKRWAAAFAIQKWFRNKNKMRKERNYFLLKKNSIVKIQRAYRSHKLRQKGLKSKDREYFLNVKKAALVIQNRFRAKRQGTFERKRFIAVKKAVVTIQQVFRTNKVVRTERLSFLQLKSTTIVIQRKFRSKKLAKKEEQSFMGIKSAAIKLQRWFRARQLMRKERQIYNKLKATAVVLQRRVRATFIARRERQSFAELKSSTVLLQRRFRANYIARTERKTFLKLKSATLLLQRKFRANCIARNERQSFVKLKSATILLQRRFRANFIARIERQSFLKLKSATVFLQKRLRANYTAKIERKTFLELKSVTLLLQQRFRANFIAKKERQSFLELKSATLLIQRRFRANCIARQSRQSFVELKLTAVLIQRRFRANRLARKERRSFVELKSATILLQRRFQANCIARQSRQSFVELKSATVLLQRRFRDNRLARKERQSFVELKSATILLQRRFQANCIAKKERQSFVELKSATVLLQRRFRANRLARKERQSFVELKSATILLQRRFQANCIAKKERQSFVELKSATVLLQRRIRANRLARKERQSFVELKSATILLQRRFQANCIAKKERQSFVELKSATVLLQRRFRANRLARKERQSFVELKSATILLQRRFQANCIAKKERQSFVELKSATVLLQRRFRANRLARKERQSFLELKSATILLQRRFQANCIAMKERQSFVELKSATHFIQRRFRANSIARQNIQSFVELKSTAVLIQRRFRANRLARKERQSFVELKSATILLQRRFQANCIGMKERQSFVELKSATLFIQRRLRANRMARQNRQSFVELKSTAVLIQRRFRANRLARIERQSFVELKSVTILLQRRFRANCIARKDRRSFVEMKSATVLLQRRFRANCLARKVRQSFVELKSATILLQRRFQANCFAKKARQSFVELKSATILLQRRFRANSVPRIDRQSFVELKSATVLLQRRFRANCIARKESQTFLKLKSATLLLQRKFRANCIARKERESFVKLKSATVLLQRRFRANCIARKDRQSFEELKSATVLLQRRFRAHCIAKEDRQSFVELKSATVLIQRRFRAISVARKERQSFVRLKLAVVLLQRKFRANRIAREERQSFVSLKSAVILIQRTLRAKQKVESERQAFLKIKSAALLVQRKFRMKLHAKQRRVSSDTKVKAAVKIQAFWRGIKVRQRITVPPPKVQPNEKLRHPITNRGAYVLQALKDWNRLSVSRLQTILYHLDIITVLSSDQCMYFALNGVVKILYNFMRSSNKNPGVYRCVELSLFTILNLYRAPNTADIVWQESLQDKGIEVLFELMLAYRSEKTSTIFCKAATVIWMFARDPVKAQEIVSLPEVPRLMKYIMNKMPNTKLGKSKKTPQPNPVKKVLPAVVPNWGNYFNHQREFEDKEFALFCVAQLLKCS